MKLEYTSAGFMLLAENESEKALIMAWNRYPQNIVRIQPEGIVFEVEFTDYTETEK